MDRVKRAFRWLGAHAHPQVVIPIIIGLGLLAYVASLVSAPHNAAQLWTAVQRTWWIVVLLTIPYLVARLYVWNDLMRELGITVPFKSLLVSFSGGEMTKSLPAGVYVENYLLKKLNHLNEEDTVRSSVATTGMLGLESALALSVVLAVGIPGQRWVRWGLIGVVVAWLVVLAGLWILVHRGGGEHSNLPGWLRHIRTDTQKFLESGGALLKPRTAINLVPTAIYMFIYPVELYFITRALPAANLGWTALITVYSVMVLAVVLIPIPTEIGISEISALGALTAFGIGHQEAAVVALSLRILGTGATIAVSAIVFLVFRRELDSVADREPGGAGSESRAAG